MIINFVIAYSLLDFQQTPFPRLKGDFNKQRKWSHPFYPISIGWAWTPLKDADMEFELLHLWYRMDIRIHSK